MGILLSKFRKKRTTYEILESLEDRIKEIEEYKSNTELQRKKIVGHLILFSVGIYVIAAILFYFFFFPATLYDQLFYITPLLIFPIIILFVKRLLTWYFNRKIRRNQTKLSEMKSEKRKILEKVMDTETYKVAKDILEKFAPEQLRKSGQTSSMDLSVAPPNKSMLVQSLNTSDIKYRSLPSTQATPIKPNNQIIGSQKIHGTATPMPYNMSLAARTPAALLPRNSSLQAPQQIIPGGAPTNLPMPRTILPRERSVLDKMVEYLVGDGPNNRFALICKNCHSHNGMALREEFEYISFRCCYCYTYNPARKMRAAAPKLEDKSSSNYRHQLSNSSTSESEKNSPPDSDEDSDDDLVRNRGGRVNDAEMKKLSSDSDQTKLSDAEQSNDDVDIRRNDNESPKLDEDKKND